MFDRSTGRLEHRFFTDLAAYLHPGDLLVLNDSRVLPARLRGTKEGSDGQVEILLVEENNPNDWWVLLRPGKRVRTGTRLRLVRPAGADGVPGKIPDTLIARVLEKNAAGHCRLQFEDVAEVRECLDAFGEVPLPPYITREGPPTTQDRERYQTVYARSPGSVAAPTAGLHFTPKTLATLAERGIESVFVTLHVGLGTFAPVKTDRVQDHTMHAEAFDLPLQTARHLNAAHADGRRIVAVGTTTVRVLESVAANAVIRERPSDLQSATVGPGQTTAVASVEGRETQSPPTGGLDHRSAPVLFQPMRGRTRIFIYPPYPFRVVGAMLTNFHLPESTLLMLVSAFASPGSDAGRVRILDAYRVAVREGYRFFSYGDAMLLV